jgi:hypothetical protein
MQEFQRLRESHQALKQNTSTLLKTINNKGEARFSLQAKKGSSNVD